MRNYKQFLFTNERLLPYEADDLNYPFSDKIIGKDVAGLPKVTRDYLIYSTTKKEVVILSHQTDKAGTISLPSKKKSLDSSDMQMVVSGEDILVYLDGQVYIISIHKKEIIDQATVFCTGLDTIGCLYSNQITYNPTLTSFGLFDLSKKESVWKVNLNNYCVKSCGNKKMVIVQDGLFLIHAYDKNDGHGLWTFDLGKHLNNDQKYFVGINSVLALFDNKVIFGCNDRLFCVDAKSGSVLWLKVLAGFEAANMSVYSNGLISCISTTSYYEIDTETGNISSYININQLTRHLSVSLFTRPVITRSHLIVFSVMNCRLIVFLKKDFQLDYELEVYNTHGGKRYQPSISAGQTPVLINNSIFTLDMDRVLREYSS